ncbi:dnaJ homolog subfamily C member 7 homolog, partial [Malus sylvestris]|uniref:dnaJ homolog subfamily C member 7 homolog n=1 Tax=Malus sylvestris TaxID=3752 RepID=UPI0021AC91F8
MKKPDRFGFDQDEVNYALNVSQGDPTTYREAMASDERDSWISAMTEEMDKKLESSVPLSVTIHELLRHKNAGNEAFRSGSYTEAVEHYTVALSSNVGSRPFSAICLCNRGAAHQALGQITDAIADGSLAIALDGNYVKAVSRRATLHEMIQDHGESASDLQRLVSILENQSNDMAKESGSQGRSSGSVKELRDG